MTRKKTLVTTTYIKYDVSDILALFENHDFPCGVILIKEGDTQDKKCMDKLLSDFLTANLFKSPF